MKSVEDIKRQLAEAGLGAKNRDNISETWQRVDAIIRQAQQEAAEEMRERCADVCVGGGVDADIDEAIWEIEIAIRALPLPDDGAARPDQDAAQEHRTCELTLRSIVKHSERKDERIAALERERDAALAQVAALVAAMTRRFEFDHGKNYSQCKVCDGLLTWWNPDTEFTIGHNHGCSVAAALAAQPPQPDDGTRGRERAGS